MFKCTLLTSSLSSNLVLKVMPQDDAFCCWVCHGRFHGILPKEYSGTFHGLPWGLYKGMHTNTQGLQTDVFLHQVEKQTLAYCVGASLIIETFYCFVSGRSVTFTNHVNTDKAAKFLENKGKVSCIRGENSTVLEPFLATTKPP